MDNTTNSTIGDAAGAKIGPRVYFGLSGWEQQELSASFYPADMPPEWQLTFYNTQFTCVWLPYARWSRAEVTEWAQWAEDTHDGFRFVLQAPPQPDSRTETVAAYLSTRLGLICPADDPRLIWVADTVDLRQLSQQLMNRQDLCYVLCRNSDFATVERINTLLGLLGL